MLRVVPINVVGPKATLTTCALLDGGATISLIDASFARALGLSGQSLQMTLRGIHGGDLQVKTQRVCFTVKGAFGEQKVEHAIIIPKLDLPCQSLSLELAQRVQAQEDIELAPFRNAPLCVLIGQDNWPLIMPDESRRLENSGLVLSHSKLGWSLHGYEIGEWGASHNLHLQAICHIDGEVKEAEGDEKLDELINRYFTLENFGTTEVTGAKRGNDRALNVLESTTRRAEKAWETGLLWKSDKMPNIDSKETALKRLYSLERKLDREPEFAAAYYKEMDRLIANGYVRKIERPKGPRIWYLPHFGVQNPNKPGKVRIVFDAAAKTKGVCLNDLLDTGPDLLESLPGVLLRFRQYTYAVTADIKDMYLRVQVREQDRSAQLFLYRGADRNREPDVMENVSLVFGLKSSPSSAIYVKNKNAERFAKRKPEAAKSIEKNSYMDDYLASANSLQEIQKLVRDVSLINREANFEMHGWASNDPRAIECVREENRLNKQTKVNLGDERDRVLGVYWDRDTDSLSFNVGLKKIRPGIAAGIVKPTKREFYSIAMSLYDPLGILAPFTMQAKFLMQKIWRSDISWDTKIRDEEHQEWLIWLKNLREVANCKIPRCFISMGTDYRSSQLHIFCDASLIAYAAVVYLRTELSNGQVHLSLVMSKTRVAPVKPMTIPRLELLAALLGARLAAAVGRELEIAIIRRVFWVDNQPVLEWIRKGQPHQKQMFVANRLGEISELTKVTEWKWVPTKLNPADDATRPSKRAMQSSDRFFTGPKFLLGPPDTWPREKTLAPEEANEIANMEAKKQFIGVAIVSERPPYTRVRVLGWRGLVAWAKRFIRIFERWRRKVNPKFTRSKSNTPEKYWCRRIQEECFALEIQALRGERKMPKNAKLAGLNVFLGNDGIMRARGRATKVEWENFQNHPVVLDANHYATRGLIHEYHRRYLHANNETVVNELRQIFYIVGLRTRLRWIAKRCIVCRRERAKPQNPPMADLPLCRVARGLRPFTHCGIDYFGPLSVRVGRRNEKRWGVLFTCMTTRAVHLELAHTLTASSTILALERLAARRGVPAFIYSDNGTNFKRADKELKIAINDMEEKQQTYANKHEIVWKFNPPEAPHMGGAWERLIRSVKIGINHILKDKAPPDEVLHTVLVEIEHMINSRPLTHVSIDPQDEEALTPNHFLIGSSSGYLRLTKYESEITHPRWQFQIAQKLLQSYWKRWLREYLPTLLPRSKWHTPSEPLKIGDAVLIVDYQAARNAWKTGRIIEVVPASDGIIRIAKVRAGKSVYIRPVHKLVKIFGDDGVEN